MFNVDKAGFSVNSFGAPRTFSRPEAFTGTPQEVGDELDRLQEVLTGLEVNDAAAAEWPLSASDPEGRVLGALRQWREQRKTALRAEISRLRAVSAQGEREEL